MYSTVPQKEYVLESNASLLRPKSVEKERESRERGGSLIQSMGTRLEGGEGAKVGRTKEHPRQSDTICHRGLMVTHESWNDNRQYGVIVCEIVVNMVLPPTTHETTG